MQRSGFDSAPGLFCVQGVYESNHTGWCCFGHWKHWSVLSLAHGLRLQPNCGSGGADVYSVSGDSAASALQPAICLKRYLMVCNKMSAMLRDYYKVRFPLEKNFLVVYDEPANKGGQDMFPVQLRERHATVSGSRSI